MSCLNAGGPRSQCCCPRALASFIHPRALESFNQWHVTHSTPIRKVFELGGITKKVNHTVHPSNFEIN